MMRKQNRVAGQSMVELVIWGTLFMVAIMTLPVVAKLADIKSKNLEATRYTLWERTVWSSGQKSDGALAAEADLRVMGHPAQALTATTRTNHPFWSHYGRPILEGEAANSSNASVLISYGEAPAENPLVRQIAYDGPQNLGLEGNGLVTVNVTTNWLNRYTVDQSETYTMYNEDQGPLVAMQSSGAILTDAWSLSSESQYQSRLDGLVIDELVGVMALPGQTVAQMLTVPLPFLGRRAFFSEALDAADVSLPVYSEVLEDKYIRDPQ